MLIEATYLPWSSSSTTTQHGNKSVLGLGGRSCSVIGPPFPGRRHSPRALLGSRRVAGQRGWVALPSWRRCGVWRGGAGLHDGAGRSGPRVVMGHNNVGPEAVGPAVTRPPLIPPFLWRSSLVPASGGSHPLPAGEDGGRSAGAGAGGGGRGQRGGTWRGRRRGFPFVMFLREPHAASLVLPCVPPRPLLFT